MINMHDQVPTVYTKASRDFQYLCWLINVVLNSVKHNVDDLYNIRSTKNPIIGQLLALTLGFKTKRNYDQKQLIALVSVIPGILRYKGTKKAIEMAGEALINASGSVGSFKCELKDNASLELTIPKDLVDTTLLTDLLPYILPAGMTCRLIKRTVVDMSIDPVEVDFGDAIRYGIIPEIVWSEDNYHSLAGLFDGTVNGFANFVLSTEDGNIYNNDDDITKVNLGLLDNTIIPALDNLPQQPHKNNVKEEE